MKQGQVYILEYSDLSLYSVVTSNLGNRFAQHHNGNCRGSTPSRRPVKLLWNTDFVDIQDAIDLEKQIKNWVGHKKKAFITENREAFHLLAQCKNPSQSKYCSLDGAFAERGRSNRDEVINGHHRNGDFRKLLL